MAQKISQETERGMKFREQGGEAIKGEITGNKLPVFIYSHAMMQMVCLHSSTVQYWWYFSEICNEYKHAVWACRDEVRKVNVRLELDLTRDVKGNKKGFYGEMGDE